MSLEVHVFASEEDANNFLDSYLQKNREALHQSLLSQKEVPPLEITCALVLTADTSGYSFYGGARNAMEVMGMDYPSPTTLAVAVRKALVGYANFLPRVLVQPLLVTVQEKSAISFDTAMEEAKEFLGALPEQLREAFYAEIGGEENLRQHVQDSLSSRGLTESEVQEFKQEYRKVPKGLD